MRGILALSIVLWATPAFSQTGAELAEQAAEAHAAYCADTAGQDVGLTSQAHARVGEVWDRVARVEDADSQPFLLYWRAKLGECLGHPELATKDYEAFLNNVGDSPLYAGLARDAVRRVRRIELVRRRQGSSGPLPEDIVLIVGGTTAGAAGVFGGLAAQQWVTLLERYDNLRDNPQSESAYLAQFNELSTLETGHVGFAMAATLTGGVGLAALIGGAVAKSKAPRTAALVVPTEGGLAFTVAGRF